MIDKKDPVYNYWKTASLASVKGYWKKAATRGETLALCDIPVINRTIEYLEKLEKSKKRHP